MRIYKAGELIFFRHTVVFWVTHNSVFRYINTDFTQVQHFSIPVLCLKAEQNMIHNGC